jgi:hypothetical protein
MAQIKVSDAAYERIETLAKKKGLTPSEWLEAQIPASDGPVNADEGQPARFKNVAEAIKPHTVDSRTHTPDPKYRSDFGDLVDKKMEEQGFKPPEWRASERRGSGRVSNWFPGLWLRPEFRVPAPEHFVQFVVQDPRSCLQQQMGTA